MRQGITHSDGCMLNCMKLRINAGNKSNTPAEDKAIANAYGDKFIISLDFEMLDISPIGDSETNYVMKLRSTITTKLLIQQEQNKMPVIRFWTYP